MTDKRMTEADVVGELRDGMTIGFGGWGSRRKPMSVVKEILRSDLEDLTIAAYGGPEVGMLCAAGKVKKVIYGFVSLDTIPLEPNFRAARQEATIEAMELDEGMFQWGLRAAAYRLPFLPTRVGLGSSVMENTPELRTVTSPYDDGEELVAMPAIHLDAAIVHANRVDERGNAQYLGQDWFYDDWFCAAATKAYVSAEKIVDTDDFWKEGDPQTIKIPRFHVSGIVEAPGGAKFTSNPPDYQRDEELQKKYATTPWAEFAEEYLA